MSYNKQYPRVYRLDAHCSYLTLDKDQGYFYYYGQIHLIGQPNSRAKRCQWSDLPPEAQSKFDKYLKQPPTYYTSLYKLGEFIYLTYRGVSIQRRRVRLHRQPTYYVRGEGFKTLWEAKAYVRSLPQASNQA